MGRGSIGLDERLDGYLADHVSAPDDVQLRLIERTAELGERAGMQIAPEQGELLRMLTSMVGASFAVEIGTFTGYSAISIARGLAADGRLLCCDVSEEWTAIAREHWALAGLDDRIDLVIAPAIDTLRGLGADPPIDIAFIDADKGGYVDYYEEILPRLAPNGIICVDNVLWSGSVVDDADQGADTVAIRRFNDHVAADVRTRQTIVPIGDGMTIIRRS